MKGDGAGLLKVKLELRKLYDRYPDEFIRIVKELQAFDVDEVLRPIKFKRGKPVHVTDFTLALLLVGYRTCHALGATRERFIELLASGKYPFNNGYAVVTWATESAVAKQLKAAEKRAKHDKDFASLVDRMIRIRESELLCLTPEE